MILAKDARKISKEYKKEEQKKRSDKNEFVKWIELRIKCSMSIGKNSTTVDTELYYIEKFLEENNGQRIPVDVVRELESHGYQVNCCDTKHCGEQVTISWDKR